jgi:tetratricopeptide (TPR) repeat protein
MIDWRLSLRRIALALIAVLCTIPIVRPSISSALVTRGDAMLFARDPRAQEKYQLALAIDPANVDAADRYVFAAFLSRKASELEAGVQLAGTVLAHDPEDATLRMDRALCLQVLKRYAAARADFEWIGKHRGDVQALALAAADARNSGRQKDARRLLLLAHRVDPTYVPVRLALARSHA